MNPTGMHTALRWRLRHSMPDVVLAIGLTDSLSARLREIVPGDSKYLLAHDFRDAERMLPSLQSACVVLAVPGAGDLAFISGYGRLRKLFPHVESMLIFVQDVSDAGAILELSVFGVSDVVTVSGRVEPETLRRGLSRCHSENVAKQLWIAAKLRIPESLVSLLKAALRKAHEPITSVRLAEAAGMHERTLRKYCAQARLPSPQWIIGWARLLVAAHYLDEPGRSVERIAELLTYPSPTALRNQLRRYTGHTATELRAMGAISCVGRALEGAVRETGAGIPDVSSPERPPLSLLH